MVRPRKKTRHAKIPPIPTAAPLGANERMLEVIFHADLVEYDYTLPNAIHHMQLSVLFMSEKRVVNLRDFIAQTSEPARGKKSQPLPVQQPRPTSIHLCLVQQRHIMSLELLRRLCDRSLQHEVEFSLPATSPAKRHSLSCSEAPSPALSKNPNGKPSAVVAAASTSNARTGKAGAAQASQQGRNVTNIDKTSSSNFASAATQGGGTSQENTRRNAGHVCIARTMLQPVDILQCTSARYDQTVLLSSVHVPATAVTNILSPLYTLSAFVAGLGACSIELRCSDAAMLTTELVRRYRPVCVTLYACEHPLQHRRKSAEAGTTGQYDEDTACDDYTQRSRLMVNCLGHTSSALTNSRTYTRDDSSDSRTRECYRGDCYSNGDNKGKGEFDTCADTVKTTSDAALPKHTTKDSSEVVLPPLRDTTQTSRQTVLHAHQSTTIRSSFSENTVQPWLIRDVFFLADLEPLCVYRRLLEDRVLVTLLDEEVGGDGVCVLSIGYGSFSLTTYLTHRQTLFNETIQLLPRRHTLAGEENCLTYGCTATVGIDFFAAPFPALCHVNRRGEVAAPHRFLSRALLRMPHTAPWVAHVLSSLLRALRSLGAVRVGVKHTTSGYDDGSGVYALRESESSVMASSSQEGELPSEATTTTNTTAMKTHPSQTTPVTGYSNSRLTGSNRDETASSRMCATTAAGSAAGHADLHDMSTEQTESTTSEVTSAYEHPLRLVSCPGVTGFEVMDASRRVICLEAPVHELRRVLRAVAQAAEEVRCDVYNRSYDAVRDCKSNDNRNSCGFYLDEDASMHHISNSNYSSTDNNTLTKSSAGAGDALEVLFNSELFVPTRIYTAFPALVTPPETKREVANAALHNCRQGGSKSSVSGRQAAGERRGSAARRGRSAETAMHRLDNIVDSSEQTRQDHPSGNNVGNDKEGGDSHDRSSTHSRDKEQGAVDQSGSRDSSVTPESGSRASSRRSTENGDSERSDSDDGEISHRTSPDAAASLISQAASLAGSRSTTTTTASSTSTMSTEAAADMTDLSTSSACAPRSHAAVEEKEEKSDCHYGATQNGDEAEAGGTGSRIHRICICDTLELLMQQQRYLLHRTISESCLSCLHKLYALSRCSTLRAAVEHHYFPSPAELIALERAFGQTLKLEDVFGQTSFDVTPAHSTAHAQTGKLNDAKSSEHTQPASSQRAVGRHVFLDPPAAQPSAAVDVHHLRPGDVGRLVSFTAKLYRASDDRANLTSSIISRKSSSSYRASNRPRCQRRRIPSAVAERFARVFWLALDEPSPSEPVMCAFDASTTMHDVIQYVVETQVIEYAGVLLLYVLSLCTLSVSQTHSRNDAYEADLRRRRVHEQKKRQEERRLSRGSKKCTHASIPFTSRKNAAYLPSLMQTNSSAASTVATVRDEYDAHRRRGAE